MFNEYKPWEREVQHSILTKVILVCHAYWFFLLMWMCNCRRAKIEWSLSQLSQNAIIYIVLLVQLHHSIPIMIFKRHLSWKHYQLVTDFPPVSGPFLRPSVWWSYRDRDAVAESCAVHVHQRQQSSEVSTDTLPELVSFLLSFLSQN